MTPKTKKKGIRKRNKRKRKRQTATEERRRRRRRETLTQSTRVKLPLTHTIKNSTQFQEMLIETMTMAKKTS